MSTAKTQEKTPTAGTLTELRRFHFAPHTVAADPDATSPRPALLAAWADAPPPRLESQYPLFLGRPEAGEGAFYLSLEDVLLRALPATEAAAPLKDRLDELAVQVRRLATGKKPLDAASLVTEAGKKLGGGLEAAVASLVAAIPAGGRFLPWSEAVPFHLLLHAAKSRTLPARTAFREEVAVAADRGRALLRESRREPSSGSDMGQMGSSFVDPSALAKVTAKRRGRSTLSEELQGELEAALALLQAFLDDDEAPQLYLVHDDGAPKVLEDLAADEPGLRTAIQDDPSAAVAELFDREAARVARVLAAMRRIRLMAEGTYEPERHGPWLEQLDWQAFSRDELGLLVPVAALESADRIAQGGMVSLSRLLLSGRPVQTLVLVEPAKNPGAEGDEALSGFRFEPAYLGLSHREALVQQTSAARPAHLVKGFFRALSATHAGLHVIAAPAGSGGELEAAAALESRAHPLFSFDPQSGSSWAERIDFSHNHAAADDWPAGELAGQEVAFTFADFALAEPSYAEHFLPVPPGVPDDELRTMAEFCAEPDAEDQRVPYVWGVAGRDRRRYAVSRPLALACRDRLGFWRTLQEMAGTRSEYARRAAERARQEAAEVAQAERVELETLHQGQLERLRREAAHDVVERLVASLLDGDVAAALAASPPPALAFQGRSVDDVAAELLRVVSAASLDGDPPAPAGGKVDELASELTRLVGDVG